MTAGVAFGVLIVALVIGGSGRQIPWVISTSA